MPAAVGVRDSDDANLTAAGTFSAVASAPVQEGPSVMQSYGDGDLTASVSLQPSSSGAIKNPFQEVNLMIAEFARQFGCAPMAAAFRIRDIIQAMYTQNPS